MDKLPALVNIHAIPAVRQEHLEVLSHHSLTLVLLHGGALFLAGVLLQTGIQIQPFPRLGILSGLRPNLQDGIRIQVPGLIFTFTADLDIPEAPVAGNIPEVAALGVGSAKEHALPGMGRDPASKAGAVLVVLAGDEGFHLVDIGLLHTRQLTNLQDPVPLQLLRCGLVVHVGKIQAVGVPVHAQLGYEGAFANALVPVEHQHGVIFDAGGVDPHIGGAQSFSRDRPHILVVLRPKVVDEQGIQTLHAIPGRQGLEHLPDGVIGPVVRHLLHSDLIVPGRKCTVVGVHIADKLGMPAQLEDHEIDAILMKADQLTAWVSDVKEYALNQALLGVDYGHFKVVEGRSTRKYTSEEDVARAVTDAGYNPYEKKLRGITAMTTLLGGERFEELLGGMVCKPPGKPALVSKSDKRPALKNTAQNDFIE